VVANDCLRIHERLEDVFESACREFHSAPRDLGLTIAALEAEAGDEAF
jgi:hypothetical protein